MDYMAYFLPTGVWQSGSGEPRVCSRRLVVGWGSLWAHIYFIFSILDCILHRAHSIWHTIYCILYSAYDILHILYCVFYIAYPILHSIFCMFYIAYYIVHTGVYYVSAGRRALGFGPLCYVLCLSLRGDTHL
jgi:hypothetical protein